MHPVLISLNDIIVHYLFRRFFIHFFNQFHKSWYNGESKNKIIGNMYSMFFSVFFMIERTRYFVATNVGTTYIYTY